MPPKINQRKEERTKYKNIIQYEERLGSESFSNPTMADTFDISPRGLGFYSNKEFKIGTILRVTSHISNDESISFLITVVRIQLYKTNPLQYLIGSEIQSIDDADKEKLKQFLQEINIYSVLEKVDLENAMDIHFMAGSPITLKTMGKLKTVGRVLDEFAIKNLLLNLLDDDHYARFMKFKDINFILNYKEKRLRFNMHLQQGKVEAICRIVNSKIPNFSQLGLPLAIEGLIKNHTKGLILIAGRTGAGKTTTLASLVSYLSKIKSGVIVSIEDPIEYIQEKNQCIVKQREIGRDTVSYASALQNALRQNPDILVIGETLNAETMELVMTAAESGALVLTTLHAGSAIQTLDRITSFFPIEAQKHILARLSLILKGVIVQELFPRLIGDEKLVLGTEIFLVNENGKKIIREGDWKLVPDYILRGKSFGMQTMKESIEALVNKGIIDMAYTKEFLPVYNPPA